MDVQLFPFHPLALLLASEPKREVEVESCLQILRAAKSQLVNASHREIAPIMSPLLELTRFCSRWLCYVITAVKCSLFVNSRLRLSCGSIGLVLSDRFRPVPLLLLRTVGSDRKRVSPEIEPKQVWPFVA